MSQESMFCCGLSEGTPHPRTDHSQLSTLCFKADLSMAFAIMKCRSLRYIRHELGICEGTSGIRELATDGVRNLF